SDNDVRVAELGARALRDALGIAEPSAREYRAWHDRTQEALDLPGLLSGVEPPFAGRSGIIRPEGELPVRSRLNIPDDVALLVSLQRTPTHIEQHQMVAPRVRYDGAAADVDVEGRHHHPTTRGHDSRRRRIGGVHQQIDL